MIVNSCAAYNCANRVEKCKPLNFDRFPLKNEDLCRQWVIAIRRQTSLRTSPIIFAVIVSPKQITTELKEELKQKNAKIKSFQQKLRRKEKKIEGQKIA